MRRTSNNDNAYRTLSPLELHEVTGGFMMSLVVKLAAPALQKDCLKKLTREGEMMYCGSNYVDGDGNIVPR